MITHGAACRLLRHEIGPIEKEGETGARGTFARFPRRASEQRGMSSRFRSMTGEKVGWPRFFGAVTGILLLISALAAPAAARSNEGMMVSPILRAPLRGEMSRPFIGDPQPVEASIEDLLVKGNGHVDVIVSIAGESGQGSQRAIPWSDLAYNPIRNDFHLRSSERKVDDYPPFHAPVAGTVGTVDGFLASKLLSGTVKTPLGHEVGTVKDARLSQEGAMQQVIFDRGDKTTSAPWSSVIEVRREAPNAASTDNAKAVVILDRGGSRDSNRH